MFSLFKDGVFSKYADSNLDLPALVKLTRENPKKDQIELITQLRVQGEIKYKELKRQLPVITPNCMLKARSLTGDGFDKNFIAFSQYIYYDFDIERNVDEFKKYMIEKFKDRAALICKSCSGGGISMLFKVSNRLTRENFPRVWTSIKENILAEEKDMLDERCKNINRAMHISYDPELFYNYDNEIEVLISDETAIDNNRCKSQSIYKYRYNKPSFTSKQISFAEALSHVNLRTNYSVNNSIVDINPIEYAQVNFPRVITDGNKRRIFSGIMYTIKYLNPNVEFVYFYRVLQEINWNFAKPKMEEKELYRLCKLHYDNITTDDLVEFPTRIKSIHFNPEAGIGTKDKIQIANYLNAAKRKAESIDKIIKAKNELQSNCNEVTKKAVQRLTGLSYPTILKYFDKEAIDLNEIIREINL
jgi:VirE N-terminal domain